MLDDNGSRSYTRAGSFKVDRDGFVVNANADKLVVNNADETGEISGAVGPLKLDRSNIIPKLLSLCYFIQYDMYVSILELNA